MRLSVLQSPTLSLNGALMAPISPDGIVPILQDLLCGMARATMARAPTPTGLRLLLCWMTQP